MKRCVLLGLGWLLLAAAGPLPKLTPPRPQLGEPFLASYPLPAAGLKLTGLPDLSPLELLAPPRGEEKELRLYLVAMRPGQIRIPGLLLQGRDGARVETAAMELRVDAGLPADAAIAPFKSWPSSAPAAGRSWWPPLVLLLAALLAWPVLVRISRRPPSLPAGDPEELLLLQLQRQLDAAPGQDDPAWRRLREELLQLRFARGPRAPQAVALFAAKVAARSGETPA